MKGQLRERVRGIMLDCKILLDVAVKAPPRAIGSEPMDEVDTLDSVGDWGPRRGGPNPDLAEGWLDRMLDIFAALGYSEEWQISFSVFQFEGTARAWWNVIKAKWEREQTPWTWVNFTREFNEKYLSPIVQERREDDFIRMRQGASSVAEYETQFTKLSRFAPDLVQTEQKRIRHFVQGLNVDIQEVFAAAQLDIFSQALEKIQRIETVMGQVKAFHDRKGGNLARETSLPDRAREMSHPLRWVEGRVVHNPQKSQIGNEGPKPPTEWTTIKPTNAGGNRPKVPARVFAMGQQEVTDPSTVIDDVRGKLIFSTLISGIRARKLLYNGARGYLAMLMNAPVDQLKIENVPVVCEFPEIFFEKLTLLPPEREVEFKIDLHPGAEPISKTPYRMAPAEVKELKTQLQELLD
ncbi:uncharacterized protein LOC113767505 [Coffea eugenioides]|uniref:uncharacterized protein LOC113767505 n=1 Tax=Coffea eugenioides TaxID=49369 RepID=UPI000F614EBF|nr:uncharacterized protein LOC113767505 [Coffea eugenioides]